MTYTIYHNPRCSKSRETLELLTRHNVDPVIVNYLDEPPTADTILQLAGATSLDLQDLVRTGETEYREARATLESADDQALADWISKHPKVLQRPIVIDESRGKGVVGRPPENVLKLIDE